MRRYVTGEAIRPDGFFDTGDLVQRAADGTLRFAGRARDDETNDAFGVKVPLAPLWARYAQELAGSTHVELFPVRGTPGMAALVFVDRADLPSGIVTDAATLARTSAAFAERTRALEATLGRFAFRHHVITRLVLVNAPVPRTTKGTVSRHRILQSHAGAVALLCEPAAAAPALLDVRPGLG
jgi:long-subunit acyl-CoA synthetase (AMP-forming)